MAQDGKAPEHYQVEDFVTDETFINYFFQLRAEDVGFWENWLLAHPDRAKLVDAAKEMLRSLTLTLPDQEIDAEMARIKAAIGFNVPLNTNPVNPKETPDVFRVLPQAAGRRSTAGKRSRLARVYLPSLLALLAAGYLVTRLLHPSGRMMEQANNTGNPMVFSMVDGTTVTLAPHSVLNYSSRFGRKDRTVFLNGEARFDVSRKTDYPFEVQEDDIVATVLGTTFTMKRLPGDSSMAVELTKGRVKVVDMAGGRTSPAVILDPDERVVFDRHGQRLFKEKWQPLGEPPIQAGHILFHRNNFEEIAAKIKSDFGVTVINRSKKSKWMFSGEFDNVTAVDIIKNICVVERLNFQETGDTIMIK